jgi:hypothetical protein
VFSKPCHSIVSSQEQHGAYKLYKYHEMLMFEGCRCMSFGLLFRHAPQLGRLPTLGVLPDAASESAPACRVPKALRRVLKRCICLNGPLLCWKSFAFVMKAPTISIGKE